jgi:anti-anti-sigma factor
MIGGGRAKTGKSAAPFPSSYGCLGQMLHEKHASLTKRERFWVDTHCMPHTSGIAADGSSFELTNQNDYEPQALICSQFVVIDTKEGVLTARLVGPHIGEREAQIIASEINAAIARAGASFKALVLDMKAVRAMSSLGLGMCIDVRNTAHAQNAKTIVVGLSRELYELFRMMKVDRLYKLAHDQSELNKLLRRR